jgi:PAS domain S-box-containing protein
LDVTERKRAEEELAHERHLMRALMDTVPVRIYFKDTASRFMRVNQAWAKQYGLSDPAQAVGKTDFDFMSAEDAQQRFDDEKSIIESDRPILNQEETIKRPDGRVVWSSTSKLALHDKNGCVVGTFGVTQDITARKQAEIALHESEARYRSLFEDSPISLWEEDFSLVKKYLDDLRALGMTDPRTYFASHSEAIAHCAGLVKVLDVNKASLALVGASSKDELLVGLSKLLADEALIVFREELIALAEGKREFESEEIHRTFSGQVRNVTLHLSVAPGFERSLGKVLVSVVDVTERKRAEDALRESEERLRTLINAMPDIVVFKDGEGRYLESNDFNLRFFQIEQVDYRGKKDSELAQTSFFLRSVLTIWKETDEAAWQARAIRRSDETIPRPNGPSMVFDLIKVPMFYPDGRRKGLVVVGRDITERKRAEEELRKAYADLERRVEERTEELVRAYARSREENAERKRTQEALKQSERKFRSIVEQSRDGVVLTDEQGTIIEWNQSQERLTGLARADVIGRPLWDVQFQVATDEERAILGTHERFKSEAIEFFTTGKSPWLNELQEREIQLPDRMRRIIQIMPFAIETDHGWMRASISRDITDRKRAEEALRESEERYHAIVEGYDGLIYICSQDQRIEFMNQRLIERTGHNAIGEVCYKALHERDSICPWCVNDQVFNGETVHWQVHSPKDDRWYYVVDTPIHHANGSMSKLAMILDITPRVEIEQALRESEAKLRAIVYGSPIPQFVIDESHTVIHWNRALEEISGIRAEEVIGTKQHWKAFYPEERPCLSDLIVDGHVEQIPDWYRGKYSKSKLVTDAYEVTDYIPMPGKEGKWLHFTAAAITDSKSNRIGAVETLEDITERKKAEDALNKNNQPCEGSADK